MNSLSRPDRVRMLACPCKGMSIRATNRVHPSTGGNRMYVAAIDGALGQEVDYGIIQKLYGLDHDARPDTRYSPKASIGVKKTVRTGTPDEKHVNTSFVERRNLTMRMHMRRFTRLTNAFSKKLENHEASVALHDMLCNFVRIHQTLRQTPATAAGLTAKVWDFEDVVALPEECEPKSKRVWSRANASDYNKNAPLA